VLSRSCGSLTVLLVRHATLTAWLLRRRLPQLVERLKGMCAEGGPTAVKAAVKALVVLLPRGEAEGLAGDLADQLLARLKVGCAFWAALLWAALRWCVAAHRWPARTVSVRQVLATLEQQPGLLAACRTPQRCGTTAACLQRSRGCPWWADCCPACLSRGRTRFLTLWWATLWRQT
jgi:hypothetical protein